MTDLQAGIGLAQLKRYDGILRRRRELIGRYDEALKGEKVQFLEHYGETWNSSGHLYLTRLTGKTREECNQIIARMAEKEIATNVHYKPLPLLTAYKNLGFDIGDYPNAYAQFENEITLPLHTCLTDGQQEFVIGMFKECAGV